MITTPSTWADPAAAGQLMYGCMRIGGVWESPTLTDQEQAAGALALDAAFAAGIRAFDHADIYCQGKSEQVFGSWLQASSIDRSTLWIQSKFGIRFSDEAGPDRYDGSADWLLASVDAALQRLQVDYLDAYLLHRPDPLLDTEPLARAMADLKSQGVIRQFGVSNMAGEQRATLEALLDQPLAISQFEMNLDNLSWVEDLIEFNTPTATPGPVGATVCEAMRSGVRLQAWGSLGGGKGLSAEDKDTALGQCIRILAAEWGVSGEAVALAFLLRHPAGIQPIIGSTDPARIQRCSETTNFELTREQWYALYAAASGRRLP